MLFFVIFTHVIVAEEVDRIRFFSPPAVRNRRRDANSRSMQIYANWWLFMQMRRWFGMASRFLFEKKKFNHQIKKFLIKAISISNNSVARWRWLPHPPTSANFIQFQCHFYIIFYKSSLTDFGSNWLSFWCHSCVISMSFFFLFCNWFCVKLFVIFMSF